MRSFELCNIRSQQRKGRAPKFFLICIVLAAILLFLSFTAAGLITLAGIASLIGGIQADNRFNELCEFSLKGTIKGILAWKAFEDQEEARAKH